jgi:zinc transport system ATP-binding protein
MPLTSTHPGHAPDEGGRKSDLPANHPAPLIEARGLTVRVGETVLLRGIDLAVAPGEIVTLVGPNGAGKTTLLRALLGILPPHQGTVKRRPGLRIGYLPQRLAIDASLPLTVWRLLSLAVPGARTGGAARMTAVLAEVGATHLAGRMLHGLSGGEFQRVLLARALVRQPELLMLDEPVQGVDIAGQVDLYELIGRLRRRRGCGVVLVSHDLHLVMSATDRVICLNQHICCSGPPSTVVRDPAYLDLFGERAASGLAYYAHAHDHTHEPALFPGRADEPDPAVDRGD